MPMMNMNMIVFVIWSFKFGACMIHHQLRIEIMILSGQPGEYEFSFSPIVMPMPPVALTRVRLLYNCTRILFVIAGAEGK